MCQEKIDVTSLEPFTKLKCPFCGQMVRVGRRCDHCMIVRQIDYGWIVCHSGPDPLPVLNTAEEAMAWADRERTVT